MSQEQDVRREPRIELGLEGPTLREPGGMAAPITLHDLSAHGFRTVWPYMLPVGKRVWLKLPGMEAMSALVAWEANYTIGCKFENPLHPAVLERLIGKYKPS